VPEPGVEPEVNGDSGNDQNSVTDLEALLNDCSGDDQNSVAGVEVVADDSSNDDQILVATAQAMVSRSVPYGLNLQVTQPNWISTDGE
jgi:hypothetical protein